MKWTHIHVNARDIDLIRTRYELERLGFSYTPSTIYESGRPYPLYLFTLKTRNRTKQHCGVSDLWGDAISVMRSDEMFRGYIESEVTADSLCCEFEETPFNSGETSSLSSFPTQPYSIVAQQKRGDVHIYRSLQTPRDELDVHLLSRDFYEVHTQQNRIFTAETESPMDALIMYNALAKYFTNTSGIKKLEFEVVRDLQTIPETFQLRQVISFD